MRLARSVQSAASKMANASKARIAVCQMTSTSDKEANFSVCKALVEEAVQAHAQVVFLPEALDFIAADPEESLRLSEPLDGDLVRRFQGLAQRLSVWISLGGLHERTALDKMHVAHVMVDSAGRLASVYRKAHLFSFGPLDESQYILPGWRVEEPVATPAGRVGLAVCYDLRFPEMSLRLRARGAELLTFPSAFTRATGEAHWAALLRARAIETQSYVVAAAQTGRHAPGRHSFGHAMVVDPWGAVVAQCSQGTGLATAQVDLELVASVRSQMPVVEHRRADLYPTELSGPLTVPPDDQIFAFGQVKVRGASIVARSKLSFAFTNKKCVVPGHMLVAPIRVAQRMGDLSAEEIADLFKLAQKIERLMEKVHDATSSTIAVQDGPEAGQTIKHLHVHVMPRKASDFKWNDEIYQQLENHDKVQDVGRWRTEEEMETEAKSLRKTFQSMGFFS